VVFCRSGIHGDGEQDEDPRPSGVFASEISGTSPGPTSGGSGSSSDPSQSSDPNNPSSDPSASDPSGSGEDDADANAAAAAAADASFFWASAGSWLSGEGYNPNPSGLSKQYLPNDPDPPDAMKIVDSTGKSSGTGDGPPTVLNSSGTNAPVDNAASSVSYVGAGPGFTATVYTPIGGMETILYANAVPTDSIDLGPSSPLSSPTGLVGSPGTAQGWTSDAPGGSDTQYVGLVLDSSQPHYTTPTGSNVYTSPDGSWVEIDPTDGTILSSGSTLAGAPAVISYQTPSGTYVEVQPDGSWHEYSQLGDRILASGTAGQAAPEAGDPNAQPLWRTLSLESGDEASGSLKGLPYSVYAAEVASNTRSSASKAGSAGPFGTGLFGGPDNGMATVADLARAAADYATSPGASGVVGGTDSGAALGGDSGPGLTITLTAPPPQPASSGATAAKPAPPDDIYAGTDAGAGTVAPSGAPAPAAAPAQPAAPAPAEPSIPVAPDAPVAAPPPQPQLPPTDPAGIPPDAIPPIPNDDPFAWFPHLPPLTSPVLPSTPTNIRRRDGSIGPPSNYLTLPNFVIGLFNTPHDFLLGTVRGTDHAQRAYYLAKYGQGWEAGFEGVASVFEYSSALLKGIAAAEGISSLGSGLRAAAVDLADAFGESVTPGGGLAYATPGGYAPIDGLPPPSVPDLEPGTSSLAVGDAAGELGAAEQQARGAAEAAGIELNPGDPEIGRIIDLGTDPAIGDKFRIAEAETALRVESETGVTLQRSGDGGVDWVDEANRTYDAVGNFDGTAQVYDKATGTTMSRFDQQWPRFQETIAEHVAGADFVPVDVSQFTPSQIAQVEAYIQRFNGRAFIVGR
jgi:hypothetical protein